MNYSINQYYQYFCEKHDASFELLDGSGVVMFSAPHSVEQTRMGKIKVAERYTGVICKMLHDQICCPVIYKTKNCGDDANFDMQSSYKQALSQYVTKKGVKILIDLHQLSAGRKVSVNLGTADLKNLSDKNCLKIFWEEFRLANVGDVLVDSPFKGAMPYTVASYIHNNCKIQTVQIEINSRLMVDEGADGSLLRVFDALKQCALKLNYYLGGTNEKRNSDG